MDRLKQLRSEVGSSQDSTLDTTSPPSEAYMTANESSKYFSLSEVDSSFDIPPKDISLMSAVDSEKNLDESDQIIANLSPIEKKGNLSNYKIGSQIEAANILSGGVNIFDDNESSYDGNELVIDDSEDKSNLESRLIGSDDKEPTEDTDAAIASKDSEVVLQIDGKNVDAIDIGNNLYLYRKDGEQELAAVQIIDDDQQQPSFKFLKVRENAEGNLEVYEEIQIEVPKEVPVKDESPDEKKTSHVPIKDINKVISDTGNKVSDKSNTEHKGVLPASSKVELENKDFQNENGKTIKFSESRKSPLMTYHSTSNKDGIPLTKTMVDQQLHPSRHSDYNKKTIEVHTDTFKVVEAPTRHKDTSTPKITMQEPNFLEQIIIKPEDEKSKENCLQVSCNEINEGKTLENIKKDMDASNLLSISHIDKVRNTCNDNTSPKKEQKISTVTPSSTQNTTKSIAELETLNNTNKISDKLDDSPSAEMPTLPINAKVDDKPVGLPSETQVNTDKNNLSILPLKRSLEKKEVDINSKLLILPPDEDKNDKTVSTPEPTNEPVKQTVLTSLETDSSESVKPLTVTSVSDQNIDKSKEEVTMQVKTDSSDKSVTTFQQKTEKGIETECSSIQTQLSFKSPVHSKESMENKICVEINRNSTSVTKENITKIKEALPTPINADLLVNTKDVNLEICQNIIDNKKYLIESKQLQYSSTPLKNEDKDETKKHVISPEKEDAVIDKVSESDTCKVVDLTKPELKNVPHISEEAKTIEASDSQSSIQNKTEIKDNLKVTKVSTNVDTKEKSVNNNHAPVPFGQWTEANRQDFLNKIKESKIPTNSNNTNQIKHSNDLNRRDVLKKFDSQRQQLNSASAKAQEHKLNLKSETTFGSKSNTNPESKIPVKLDTQILTNKLNKSIAKDVTLKANETLSNTNLTNKESIHRKEVNHQVLIDKAVEGIIQKNLLSKEDNKQTIHKDSVTCSKTTNKGSCQINKYAIDAIEMKMNELHGIPFVERPPHELPKIYNKDIKTFTQVENQKTPISKTNKIPNLLPISNKHVQKTGTDADVDSEEEIIEHEPITGDIDLNKTTPLKAEIVTVTESAKKESIITENEFDRFARRNSITYENCLTVKFDGKDPHNVVQTVIQKDVVGKKCNRNEALLAEAKAKAPHKPPHTIRQINTKLETSPRIVPIKNDKHCQQSKLKLAYQTALNVKKQAEYPSSVIEDKPVKVVYMDQNIDFIPTQLNVQGAELSPPKKPFSDFDVFTTTTGDSLDSTDALDTTEENKIQDESKIKKHQRKQILNPVKSPDLELIEPADLGISVYSKKKRRVDDKSEKYSKNILSKKTYLLAGNMGAKDKITKVQDTKIPFQNTISQNEKPVSCDAVSAIDNLVKAAELLDSQSENLNLTNITNTTDPDVTQSTPIKRGRGRPRKYPLPENSTETPKTPNPQKKPRLQAEVKKLKKTNSSTDEFSTDDEMVRENWTMGKINENIVCPICQKLFRSENVVFKHVKHCTGPSPNRSDSDKRTSLRNRSKDSQTFSDESDIEEVRDKKKRLTKKRKSRDSVSKANSNEIIVIEETPDKRKLEKALESKQPESKEPLLKLQPSLKRSNLSCEICGKTFRQLSYLANHKLQHKKDLNQPTSDVATRIDKSVFSCEVCKKEFRKLHHLVQHRIIHDPNIPSRVLRKSSSELTDKTVQDYCIVKNDDPSAAFRCEPCDKSFRKLHHLVEHRETHDGINRQKNTSAQTTTEKTVSLPQCDKCNKTFRKKHHLINHKEQEHSETGSEKSDDKSVKSALSTKDIIHECSLCYMVFPNEHSLTKHTIICKRKKKQSASKQAQSDDVSKNNEEIGEPINLEIPDTEEVTLHERISEERTEIQDKVETEDTIHKQERAVTPATDKSDAKRHDEPPHKELETTVETIQTPTIKRDISKVDNIEHELPPKVKRTIDREIKTKDSFKRSSISREKTKKSAVKQHKKVTSLLQSIDNKETKLESSDEEIRYMINPGFKEEPLKTFEKVQAKKRNSLQVERPNSKDLVKRRTSLQNPPKVARLKSKQPEPKATKIVKTPKSVKVKTVSLTDSDDSDTTKYSFPKIVHEKSQKSEKITAKPVSKTVTEERKSLTGVPKRKTLHNVISTKYKAKSPVNIIKKRTTDALHRCDCGELFSSAALLSRHTTLAHTPPRIRRRRSPSVTVTAPTTVKTNNRKSSVRSYASSSKKADVKTPRKSGDIKEKVSRKSNTTLSSGRKMAAHKGVPVPEKMRKLRASLKVSNVF